ncbi:hypothetical protein R1flu_004029 [Riccia fluitans]|uniref:DDE Tnp4 domain-containing protein n=1 Tax=Riccia fluitans TaxID=41844 RepID=A0ABD1YPI4_9MARC
MPRISERQAMLDDLERWMELKATADLASSSKSDSDWDFNSSGSVNSWDENSNAELVSDGFDSIDSSSSDKELMELFCMLEESRYVTRPPKWIKSKDFISNYFFNLPPNAFRSFTRMTRSSFMELVSKIADHPMFHNNSPYAQAPLAMQLAVVLDRFGHEGNGACFSHSLMLWGLDEGSMVNYTNTIMIALRDKLRYLVSWPTTSKRRRISAAFVEKGFLGCVGLIDGTLIPLSQRPHDGNEMYHDRKSQYLYNAQIINDYRRRILWSQIKDRWCSRYAMKWISCCVLLHNFLIEKDEWTEADDDIELEPLDALKDVDYHEYLKDSIEAHDVGLRLRTAVRLTLPCQAGLHGLTQSTQKN